MRAFVRVFVAELTGEGLVFVGDVGRLICSVRQIQHGLGARIILRLLEELSLLRPGEHLRDHGRPRLREPDITGDHIGSTLRDGAGDVHHR